MPGNQRSSSINVRSNADCVDHGHQPLHERQRSEQYLTWSQSRDHFLRQVKGSPQAAQILLGKSPFLTILGMRGSIAARGVPRKAQYRFDGWSVIAP